MAHATIPPRPLPSRGGPPAAAVPRWAAGRCRPAVGRRPGPKGNGAAPLASRLLRIALRATAPRADRDPGASTAPGQEKRAGPGLPPLPGPASGGRTYPSRRNR